MKLSHIFSIALALIGTSLFLISCGGSGSSSSNNGRALAQLEVSNSVVDALMAQGYIVKSYTGAENPADYNLVIIDADNHDPAVIASDELLIDETLAAEKPLLIVDADAAHIQEGLLQHTGVSTDGDHLAYLVMTERDSAGNLSHHSYSYRNLSAYQTLVESEVTNFESDEADVQELPEGDEVSFSASVQDEAVLAAEYAQEIISIIQSESDAIATRDASDFFDVGRPIEGVLGGTTQRHTFPQRLTIKTKYSDNPQIIADLRSTVSVWAYYDPVDVEYKVILNNSGTAYLPDDKRYQYFKSIVRDTFLLYQRSIANSTECTNSAAFVLSSSPPNVNNKKEYTDSVSTTIGGSISNSGVSVSGSRTVSHSVTKTITDWSINNTSPGFSLGRWNYFQTSGSYKKRYSSLPSLSRFNFDYSNSTIWQVSPDDVGSDRKLTFIINTKRDFAFAGEILKVGGLVGSYDMPALHHTITLPEIPVS